MLEYGQDVPVEPCIVGSCHVHSHQYYIRNWYYPRVGSAASLNTISSPKLEISFNTSSHSFSESNPTKTLSVGCPSDALTI